MKRNVQKLLAVLLAVAALCGCDKEPKAQNSSIFSNAMEDYQAGRLEPAEAGFKNVLKENPSHYLAHFQLATLLQDNRKDYIGALIHYQAYLDARPETDKTTLAQDRSARCKDLLIAEYAQKAGVRPQRDGNGADIRKLESDNARLASELDRVKKENGNLRYLVKNLGSSGAKAASGSSSISAEAKKLLAELREDGDEKAPSRTIIPTDTELLDDDGESRPLVASKDVKNQIADIKRGERSGPSRPTPIKKPALAKDDVSGPPRPPAIKKPPLIVDNSPAPTPTPTAGSVRTGGLNGLLGGGNKTPASNRPETYVVQPGDTLMHIAARFYGSRSKWRAIQDANKATIPANGDLKVGQTIKLP